MKKIVSMLFILALLTGTALAATYTTVSIDYPVIVNGTAMSFADAEPMNYNGRTMLPLRAVSEALGVPITWDDAKRQVTIQTIDTEALKQSCVLLHARYSDGKQGTRSSGVLIDYDTLLTCYHCVDENANQFWADYEDGTKVNMSLDDTAPSEDAATLKPASMNVKPVKIGDSDELKVGDSIYVVSSPNGVVNVVTSGKVTEFSTYKGIIIFVTNAKVEPGSSGGAVFNARGELIGLVDAMSDKNDESYMIPINDVRKALAA